jgi:hypothetical protein
MWIRDEKKSDPGFGMEKSRIRDKHPGSVCCTEANVVCTDLFENFSVNSLMHDLSNDASFNPPLVSLLNTFNVKKKGLDCLIITPMIVVFGVRRFGDTSLSLISKHIQTTKHLCPDKTQYILPFHGRKMTDFPAKGDWRTSNFIYFS